MKQPRAEWKLLQGSLLWWWGDSGALSSESIPVVAPCDRGRLDKTCSLAFSFGLNPPGISWRDRNRWQTRKWTWTTLTFWGRYSSQRRSQQPRKKGQSYCWRWRRIMALNWWQERKFRKYGQVKRIVIHLQKSPIYYAKFGVNIWFFG